MCYKKCPSIVQSHGIFDNKCGGDDRAIRGNTCSKGKQTTKNPEWTWFSFDVGKWRLCLSLVCENTVWNRATCCLRMFTFVSSILDCNLSVCVTSATHAPCYIFKRQSLLICVVVRVDWCMNLAKSTNAVTFIVMAKLFRNHTINRKKKRLANIRSASPFEWTHYLNAM